MTSQNGNGALGFNDYVAAALELVRGQFFSSDDLEPISRSAARLLVEQGIVATEGQGQVLFHETIARNKPALRKILRNVDRRAGRIPRRKTTAAQRAVFLALKAGEVKRLQGRITGFTKIALRAIRVAKQRDAERAKAARQKRQSTARAKLGGFATRRKRRR